MQRSVNCDLFHGLTVVCLASLFTSAASPAAQAQGVMGSAFTYQGRLDDAGSAADGTYDLQFTLHDAAKGGQAVGTIVRLEGIEVKNGLFTAELDFGKAAFDGRPRYLEVGVRGAEEERAFTTLEPRQPLTPAPYALYALDGPSGIQTTPGPEPLAGAHWGESWSGSGVGLTLESAEDSGLVAITDASPGWHVSAVSGEFHGSMNGTGVSGESRADNGTGVSGLGFHGVVGVSLASSGGTGVLGSVPVGPGTGVVGQAITATGIGVEGAAGWGFADDSSAYGVRGKNYSGLGAGVYGRSFHTGGVNFGVQGISDSGSGTGVRGEATAVAGLAYGVDGVSSSSSGTGLRGSATASSGSTYGVQGISSSTSGTGVYGNANSSSGTTYGLRGSAQSSSGTGVYGIVTSSQGSTTGVRGESGSQTGTGVRGVATATTGTCYGVQGSSISPTGLGVYGLASAASGINNGVYGRSDSISGRGVFGYASATTGSAYGVYGASNSAAGIGIFAHNTAGGAGLFARSATGNPIEAHSAGDREFYVSNTGNVYADGVYNSNGADFAELLPAAEGLEPGDVLAVGEDGRLTRSLAAFQTSVLGIYSTQPGFLGGSGDAASAKGKVPLAVLGIVPVKASAENGAIRPGDLLVASSTPGHAMRAGHSAPPVGTVLGKALQELDKGTGAIRMLVTLQ